MPNTPSFSPCIGPKELHDCYGPFAIFVAAVSPLLFPPHLLLSNNHEKSHFRLFAAGGYCIAPV